MKIIAINAGPKRKDINAQLIKSAVKGAESAGADVKYVDLYKLDLRGCMMCLICKKEGMESCRCYWRDELSPLIADILSADALLIASPIFFTEPTSHYKALMERLIYCIVSYKTGNSFTGNVNVGLFYTLNYSKDYFEQSVRPHLKQSEDLFKMLNGNFEIHTFRNISQREYSKSDDSLKQKEQRLSLDLKEAFEIGARFGKS